MAETQHVTPKGDKWQVKGAGNEKATKLFDTQKEAIEYARKIAGNSDKSVIIHGTDGKVRDSIGGTKKEEPKAKAKEEPKAKGKK